LPHRNTTVQFLTLYTDPERRPGLENGFEKNLGFKKNLKTSKVQNLGFLGFLFLCQILYKPY